MATISTLEFMTDSLIYNPDFRTQCVTLNAQASSDVPRGTIIARKGTADVTATFTGTEAALSGDAQNYTPAGTVAITSGVNADDGSFDVIGASGGAYAVPVGILLNDAPKNASTQPVDILVFGEVFKNAVDAIYYAATTQHLSNALVSALRDRGIFLK